MQQLKTLEQQLRAAKAGSKPQGKFSFKRSKPAAKAAPPPDAAPVPALPSERPSSSLVPNTSNGHEVSSLSNTCITSSSVWGDDGADILLSSLQHCLVNLIPPTRSNDSTPPSYGSIHARALTRTVLLLPDIPGSVFLEECNECLVVVGCHQFRMHASTNTTVLLSVKSVPIIEDCSSITVGAYPEVLRASRASGTALASKHAEMQDFKWLQPGQSPNWSLISADSASRFEDRVRSLLQVPQGPIAEGALGL